MNNVSLRKNSVKLIQGIADPFLFSIEKNNMPIVGFSLFMGFDDRKTENNNSLISYNDYGRSLVCKNDQINVDKEIYVIMFQYNLQ